MTRKPTPDHKKIATDITRLQQDLERQKNALIKAMDQLGDIVSTIGGIAAQTNMLALNARTEAARAAMIQQGSIAIAATA
ncbi:methyl-accepting chemotaxis protein [Sphingobium sp. EM0848]|uniref:methyl-accepting chemotaxis protein n=1 Tax=Sphingobium sp. EM0848 TaxID=2743473 RepID=UPI00350EAB63